MQDFEGAFTMGKLFVVAVPIGNLEDITFRAVRILKEVDAILCEDTRRARILLGRYGITGKKLISYYEGNERRRSLEALDMLTQGLNLALITDAGTPTISDPGYRVVRLCRENGIEVIPVPGPSALISALSVSGIETDRFVFLGFPPKKLTRLKKLLEEFRNFEGSIVIYESVHRIERTLEIILDVLGDRRVFVAREMTKLHEEYIFGWLSEVKDRISAKGEFVIVISKECRC